MSRGAGPHAFRTILAGQCLVDGRHEPGSKLAEECPLLRRQRRPVAKREGRR